MRFLRTNTAVRLTIGPFLDKTDGITPKTGLTVTSEKLTFVVDDANVPTLVLDTSPTASGGNNDMVHITGDDSGFYDLELTAANTNYLGRAMLSLNDVATHCPVFHEFMILPAMIYDSMVLGTDRLDTNVTHVTDTAQTARDIGAAVPNAVPGAAGGLFIAGTNAPVTITGAGSALTLTSTSGNGYGLLASGQGTGAGVGAVGGATNGHGIASVAQGSGSGVYTIASGATGNGFFAQGNTTGFGIGAIGGTDGHGIVGQGGVNTTPTGTHGIYGQAGSNNGTGLRGQGCITNGDGNSIGIGGVGSVQGGAGIKGVALANTFAGIQGIGVTTGPGALFEGGTTGAGAGFLGGATSGAGVSFAAQAGNSDGITSTKSGSGYALNITSINSACDLTSTMKTSVNTEVVDGLNVDTYAEIGQEAPAATQSMRKMLAYLYKAWRNRSSQTSTAYKLYSDDATTVDHKSTVSDDGTTFESGEKATGP